MPCYESRDSVSEMWKKLSAATRAACDLARALRDGTGAASASLSEETKEWIRIHDFQDADRLKQEQASGERERIREQALSKLNQDERRALGLK